jgi:hypothetical protein
MTRIAVALSIRRRLLRRWQHRSYEPFGGDAGWRRPKIFDRIHRTRREMLSRCKQTCNPNTGRISEPTLFTRMAIHVSLEGAWSGESLIADFAFVLLLGNCRNLGAKLAHHRLGRRRGSRGLRRGRWQCAMVKFHRFRGRAVVCQGVLSC